MENLNNYSEKLKIMLYQLFPGAKTNGAGTEVMIPCPFCKQEGNPDHDHHMYISLGYDGRPPQYNCFRNSLHHGLLTYPVLERMTDYPQLIDSNLIDDMMESSRQNTFKNLFKLNEYGKYNINAYNPDYSELIEVKRKYICNRLGIDLSIEELVSKKVIFSIKDFLRMNYLQPTRSEMIIESLEKYFVGFLNNTNSNIIMRNMVCDKLQLHESLNKRYVNYVTVRNGENISGYYIIPTNCDLLKHITINIAEGVFDILSVYYNIKNKDENNQIYCSMGNNLYLKCIRYFLETFGLIDIEIHIYIDNDIKKNVVDGIGQYITPLQIPIYIHNNIYPGEKDFGVPREKIKEYIYKL